MNTPTIPITPPMLAKAKAIANSRNQTKQPWQNNSTLKHTDTHTHLIGALGELAFSQLTSLPIDTTPRINGDDGHDFQPLPNLTIEVKTRIDNNQPPDLALYHQDPSYANADFYVLCILSPNLKLATFPGFTSKLRLLYQGQPLQYGNHTRFGIQHHLLFPLHYLLDFLTKVSNYQAPSKPQPLPLPLNS